MDLKFDYILDILLSEDYVSIFELVLANYAYKIGYVFNCGNDFESSPIVSYRIIMCIK